MDVLKDLRNRTGAPIVDCKKAIQEAQKSFVSSDSKDSDTTTTDLYQTALDWLRSHGAAKASTKVAGRTTTQGLVALQTSPDATTAALVKVAAETDFAALSTTFVQLVQTIVQTVLHQPPPAAAAAAAATANETMEATILQQPAVLPVTTDAETTSNIITIQDCLQDAIVSIRENISITDAVHFPKVTTSDPENTGIYVGYVHNKVDTTTSGLDVNAGTAAAMVLLVPHAPTATTTKHLSLEEYQHIGKLLAMHIVAAKPQYLSTTDVPAAIYDQERTILQQQLENDPAQHKKPAHIVEQIIRGKLQKYVESIVLLEQAHMIVPDHPKIAQYLQEHGLTLQRYEYLTI